jgi:hypothetical protein
MKPAKRKLPLRRRRIARAAEDVSQGRKDTERRGLPNDVPSPKFRREKRAA